MNTIDDFWKNVHKHLGKGCWEWKLWRDKDGYGYWDYRGKPYKAHRFVASMIRPLYT